MTKITIRVLKQENDTPFQDVTVGKTYPAEVIAVGDQVAFEDDIIGSILYGTAQETGVRFRDDTGEACYTPDSRNEGRYEVVTE